jgi:RES domain
MPATIKPPDIGRLHRRTLPIVEISLEVWLRVSAALHPSVVYFGKGPRYRFDDPLAKYGVLYAGSNYLTCVAESVLRDELRIGARPLYKNDLDVRIIANLAPIAPQLQLVDLTEAVGLGLDGQIATHPGYALTQEWSRALHEHPAKPDGLYYVSRNYPKGQAIAVFERGGARVGIAEMHGSRKTLTAHPDYAALLRLLDKNNIDLRLTQ